MGSQVEGDWVERRMLKIQVTRQPPSLCCTLRGTENSLPLANFVAN